MKAKELALRGNVSVHTIRFYADCGLLEPSRDRFNNYRQYSDRDLCRLRAVGVLKCLGLALQEIRAVFTVEASGGDLQSLIRGALERHLGKQEEAMERLKARRRSIDLIFREWSGLPWEANEASALCSAMREVSELDTGFLEGFARGGAAHARDVIAPVGDDGHANDNPPRMAEREPAGADLEASPRSGKSGTHHEDRSSALLGWLYRHPSAFAVDGELSATLVD